MAKNLCPPTSGGVGHTIVRMDPISVSTGIRVSLVHGIFGAGGWIFIELAEICLWDVLKCLLAFGDLELIFKVTVLQIIKFLLETAYVYSISCTNGWILVSSMKQCEELIRFCDLDLSFNFNQKHLMRT